MDKLATDRHCWVLDEIGFQVGATAKVIGPYAEEWPEPVRILGINMKFDKIDITVGTLAGDEPTDGFGIEEIAPEHRHTAASRRIQALEAELAGVRAEMQRRDDNETRNCLNWGPCSRHDGRMSEAGIQAEAEARAILHRGEVEPQS